MPKYRSNRKFKRGRKSKPRYVSKKTKFGISKSLGYKGFHCFKEKTQGTLSISNYSPLTATTPVLQALEVNGVPQPNARWRFLITHLTDWQNYSNLFRQYRITGVKIQFYPCHNVSAFPVDVDNVINLRQDPDVPDPTDPGTNAYTITSADPNPPPAELPNTSNQASACIPSLVWKQTSVVPTANPYPATFADMLEHDPKFSRANRPFSIYVKPRLTSTDSAGQVIETSAGKWCNFQALDTQPAAYPYQGLLMGAHNIDRRMQIPFIMTYYFQCKNQS